MFEAGRVLSPVVSHFFDVFHYLNLSSIFVNEKFEEQVVKYVVFIILSLNKLSSHLYSTIYKIVARGPVTTTKKFISIYKQRK